ncbi:hypothetical protein U2G91_21210 [Rhodococcoides fascians]|uniref:hypothetical protein n=1 Tax=Rhodococcoides fascians TaxID=1828 RepID=UPI002ACDF3F3|nr:hypothetical protein [Rhodococcus fascians]WQH27557.1 hypothetical protein U2G91_21210 [Rhodococcus fascians]
MNTSSPAARRSHTIDVLVTSAAPIGYDDTCSSTERRFATPSAAARFAVTQSAALDFDSTDITVTITVDGACDVCVSAPARSPAHSPPSRSTASASAQRGYRHRATCVPPSTRSPCRSSGRAASAPMAV